MHFNEVLCVNEVVSNSHIWIRQKSNVSAVNMAMLAYISYDKGGTESLVCSKIRFVCGNQLNFIFEFASFPRCLKNLTVIRTIPGTNVCIRCVVCLVYANLSNHMWGTDASLSVALPHNLFGRFPWVCTRTSCPCLINSSASQTLWNKRELRYVFICYQSTAKFLIFTTLYHSNPSS